MALFKPYKITSDKLADLPVREGQIIITTDTRKLYVDVSATERIEVTSDAEVDLTDYVTTTMLSSAIGEEASEREKQDNLLDDKINTKLDTTQADDRYALKNYPKLTGNVEIISNGWAGSRIIGAHPNGDVADYYQYVIGFDALHRPYIAKRENGDNISVIYLDADKIIFNKPLAFTGPSGSESYNSEASVQTRQNIGAAAINHTHDVATAATAGFMSAEDKEKLDGLEQVDVSKFVTKEDADATYAAITHNHDDRYYTESEVDSKLADKANVTHTHTIANVTDLQETIDGLEQDIAGKANISHTHDDRYFTEAEVTDKLSAKANLSHKHDAGDIETGTILPDRLPSITDNKIVSLSASKLTGTIPTANLPSYVDDVVEGETTADFPKTGEAGKIYVATSTNKTYRWGGSSYVEISASLALGTTSSTAFRGDYGNTAYQHATAKGAAFGSGLYKITTNSQGHVTAATAVTKSDITALGIPGSDTNTNTTYELIKSGSTITLEGSDGSSTSVTDANTVYTHPTTSGNKHIPAGGSSGQILRWSADGTAAWGADNNTNTTYTLSKSGSTITLIGSDGSKTSVTDSDTNTTYTLGSFGITATAAELNKLDGVTATATELNYVDGVTSNIQTQLNGKAASSHTHSNATTAAAGFLPKLGGGTTNFLRADGTWAKPPDTNTTYSDMKGATSSAAGTHGLVPAPAAGAATRYLRSDGTWQVPPDTNTTYTLSSFGITATAAELNKLDGVTATAAELNYVDGVTSNIQTQLNGKAASSHSHSVASTSAAGFLRQLNGSTANYLRGDGTWATPPNTTYSAMKGSTSSAAGSAGLVPAPAAGASTRYLRCDGTWAVPPDTNTTYTLSSFGITATAAEINKLDGLTATTAELNYVDGVTSNIQTQLNGKAASSHTHSAATTTAAGFLPKLGGGTTNFLRADGTWAKPPDTNTNTTYTLTKSGSTITLTGSDGKKTSVTDSNTTYSLSSFGITATAAELNKLDGCTATVTELNYVDGVTSNIQTQLNGKASSSHTHYNLSFRGAVGATTNWNSLSDGIWSVGQSTFSATYNQPVGAYTYGTLRVYNNGSNIAQIYIAHSNGQMWFRDRFSSSNDFTPWARTYTTLSKPTASEIGAAASSHSHSNYLTTSGTAAAATKLATARTFSLTGDVTGSASFNGTANCSIATTLAANSVTANEIATGAVGLSELSSAVGTVAVQSAAPTDSHVKLWIKV